MRAQCAHKKTVEWNTGDRERKVVLLEELKLLSASRTPRMGSVGDEKWRACSRCSTQHTPEWTLMHGLCIYPSYEYVKISVNQAVTNLR